MATVLATGHAAAIAGVACCSSARVSPLPSTAALAGPTGLSTSFLRLEPTAVVSSLNSSFQGQACSDAALMHFANVAMPSWGVTTCMAWGGTLAGVRLVVQGKHMEVPNYCNIPCHLNLLLRSYFSVELSGI